MRNLIHLIYNSFHIIAAHIALGKCTFHETALEVRRSSGYTTQCGIECNIKSRSRSIDNSAPSGFQWKIICAISKGCIFKKKQT